MSIFLKDGLAVKIFQLDGQFAPRPLPLENGFRPNIPYEVLGIYSASESAEAFLILRNDRDEMWFISNRHCRITDIPVAHLSFAELEEESTEFSPVSNSARNK